MNRGQEWRSGSVPVGREEVWAAITRPEELSRWFGMEVVSLDLRPAGPHRLQGRRRHVAPALVEEVEPPCRFVFRWLPTPAGGPARDPGSRSTSCWRRSPRARS